MSAVVFLTAPELAERLRTSVAALHMQRHRGQMPGSLGVMVGRRCLWSVAAVDQWYAAQLAETAKAVESRRP